MKHFQFNINFPDNEIRQSHFKEKKLQTISFMKIDTYILYKISANKIQQYMSNRHNDQEDNNSRNAKLV